MRIAVRWEASNIQKQIGGARMLTKQCQRCKRIIPYSMNYCGACQSIIEQQKKASRAKQTRYYDNNKRDKRSTAFYNSPAWKLLSRTVLQRDQYKCQICGEIATEVHHCIPIKKDWSKRFDINNLMSVCTSCHNKLDR